ncbi:threonine transporter RhtB [Tersicoccus solisilvae]|uniref:Threonine transporter RhtB n=1 Tax=Tersicoccus solisilvae TaxID=1882339 RepID=A0ABQ1PHW5_9MICC|nr:LysE family translocator [Tersicoccus solisilvae]GGC97467.1 threonine transporter RhtB [Tersicoccus solisilvae]
MTILDAVLAFAVVAGLLTLVPGLDTALVLRSSLTRTRPYAWATALGVATGAMVWGIAAAVGVSALLAASEVAYRALTIAGAGYMLWLGGSMIVRSVRHGRTAPQQLHDQLPPVPTSAGRGWLVGAGTNLLNPKVGVFYLATVPQFLPAGVPPLLMGVILAGVHATLTMTWFGVLIVGGRWARRWLSSPRSLRIIDRITGVVLLGFGGTLAVESVTGGAPTAR